MYAPTSGDGGSTSTTEPNSLTIEILQEITDNFSEKRAVGEGSYGRVYKVKIHPENTCRLFLILAIRYAILGPFFC